jgi:hypothetical protein
MTIHDQAALVSIRAQIAALEDDLRHGAIPQFLPPEERRDALEGMLRVAAELSALADEAQRLLRRQNEAA